MKYNLYIVIFVFYNFFIYKLFFYKKINKIKQEISKKYSEEILEDIENLDSLDQDLYIEYYKEKNILKIIRFWVFFILFVSFIILKFPGIFNFLAIAIGAIIITMKEILLSFISFFYTSTHYKIWENIVTWDINNTIRWEIVYINMLNIGLIWKTESWEYNWEIYTIPNFKLLLENIRKEELGLNSFRKQEIKIYFTSSIFNMKFDNFISELKIFLDTELLRCNINTIWNYKTYLWYKYKIKFLYDKEYLIIRISFIEKVKKWLFIKNKIISFIESKKNN